MARIKHPRPQLGRVKDTIGGVEFVDGYADVDLSDKPNLRDAYALHGYEVQPEVAELALIDQTAAADHDGADPLDSLSVPELKALADEAGIASKSSWRKSDYIEALANHLETILTPASDGEFAIVELADGTVVGDGKSLATLPFAEPKAGDEAYIPLNAPKRTTED